MCSIFGSLLSGSRPKIAAMCQGLAMASLLLWAAKSVELEALIPRLLWDDVFFGRQWPYVSFYYLADAVVMGAVAAAMY